MTGGPQASVVTILLSRKEKFSSLERKGSLGYEDCPILALSGHLKVSSCWGWVLSFFAMGRPSCMGPAKTQAPRDVFCYIVFLPQN